MEAVAKAHVVRSAERDAWDTSLSLRACRAEYFRFNEFGDDGGYSAKWVDFKLGPIPFPFPNTPQRIVAVKYHDLHHLMTGYRTNFVGELEISAWEIGSGCRGMIAAWVLNLGGMAMGMFIAPSRTVAAYARGRRSNNLYGHVFDDALLDRNLGEVRRELSLEREPSPTTAGDVAFALLWGALGLVLGTLLFLLVLPLAPIGYLAGKLART